MLAREKYVMPFPAGEEKMNHKQFGNRTINALNHILPRSALKKHKWGVWLDITQVFNVRLIIGWRAHPNSCYMVLFKGAGPQDYVLELDLSLVVQRNSRFIWFLNPPTNKITLEVMERVLGQRQVADQEYRQSVKEAKEALGQPLKALVQGYCLADSLTFNETLNSLIMLISALVDQHGGVRPTPRQAQNMLVLEDVLAELDRNTILSLKDSSEKRKDRLTNASRVPEMITVTTTAFRRNPDVVAEVLLRAGGKCEKCTKPAPFLRKADGTPYLEVHHIKLLSQGGEDTVENSIAMCPNCHREVHFA